MENQDIFCRLNGYRFLPDTKFVQICSNGRYVIYRTSDFWFVQQLSQNDGDGARSVRSTYIIYIIYQYKILWCVICVKLVECVYRYSAYRVLIMILILIVCVYWSLWPYTMKCLYSKCWYLTFTNRNVSLGHYSTAFREMRSSHMSIYNVLVLTLPDKFHRNG